MCFILCVPFLYSQDNIEETDDDNEKLNQSKIVKIGLLFGYHIPDEEFNEGYNVAVMLNNSINKYAFFTFDFNYDKFYGINEHKRKYTITEISIGVGVFFNFLRFENNVSCLGIELGSYHIKNTDYLQSNTPGNNLMIAWILGHSYSIKTNLYIEGLIRFKANHFRNLSINLGVAYKISK
jgi:hypothetical protein